MQPLVAIPAKATHLLAGAVWLGGLLWLLATDRSDRPSFAREASRVSAMALICVVLVALSGVVQTWLFLPSLWDLFRSSYGAVALAKVAGLAVLIAFGAFHRARVLPRLERDAAMPGAVRHVACARSWRHVSRRAARWFARVSVAATCHGTLDVIQSQRRPGMTMPVFSRSRRPSSRRASRLAAAFIATVALALIVPAIAFGHAVVFPKTSTPGAFERYVLRVPNEKAVATTRVEIRFPADARVTSFEDVAGWQLEVLTDSAKKIVGAVWTGSLPPQRFVEFPFMAANPKTNTQLVWPAYQTYADGERVEWTGEQGSKTPASSTSIAPAGGSASGGGVATWAPWAALVLALISLGIALRRSDTRSVA